MDQLHCSSSHQVFSIHACSGCYIARTGRGRWRKGGGTDRKRTKPSKGERSVLWNLYGFEWDMTVYEATPTGVSVIQLLLDHTPQDSLDIDERILTNFF